jgi:hypothetical protein
MNDAPFRVPFIFASERHLVSLSQAEYSRRNIDVVCDEEGLPRAEQQDETLMPASIVIVREKPFDHAPAFDLKVAGALFEGETQDSVAFRRALPLCARRLRRAAEKAKPE